MSLSFVIGPSAVINGLQSQARCLLTPGNFCFTALRYTENIIERFLQHRLLFLALALATVSVFTSVGCRRQGGQKQTVRPRTLRDVPAGRLAYQFTADSEPPPSAGQMDEANTLVASVQKDFDTHRPEDALLRTVMSPDRQRVLVIYATGGDEPNEFRLDVYGTAGDLQRHVTPAGLAVVFPSVASWSPDSGFISFIAFKSSAPQPTPTPFEDVVPETVPGMPAASPLPIPTIGPIVPTFSTEQIYICSRDGFDLKPMTMREGLIYFYLTWAPDSHALAALACKENEWRESPLQPAGRPRLIGLDGSERLLDDALSDVLPVWSPDSSKVATAVETDVRIYDALTTTPTQAMIPLRETLLEASRAYDKKEAAKTNVASGDSANDATKDANSAPISFNPVVNLEWPKPELLYLQTGYVRNYTNEQRRTWMRWHLLRLSAQAALLG